MRILRYLLSGAILGGALLWQRRCLDGLHSIEECRINGCPCTPKGTFGRRSRITFSASCEEASEVHQTRGTEEETMGPRLSHPSPS